MIRAISALAAAVIAAAPALAQTLPSELEGAWDVSDDACAEPGTSVTRVDITAGRIDTFGGNAQIREVERIGDVVFAAGDFEQLEGAAAVEPRTREYFRFESRDGAGRMTFVWKDVRTDVLVRCDGAEVVAPEPSNSEATQTAVFDGPLPIPMGFWVIAGDTCETPANASWRVYDGVGLRGASSTGCEIDATEPQGDSIVVSQTCAARYDGEVRPTRDRITITAPRRFTLFEGQAERGQDFNWCGPRLAP